MPTPSRIPWQLTATQAYLSQSNGPGAMCQRQNRLGGGCFARPVFCIPSRIGVLWLGIRPSKTSQGVVIFIGATSIRALSIAYPM